MRPETGKLYHDVARAVALILVAAAGCKFIRAPFAGALAAVGLFWAFGRKTGLAMATVTFFAVMCSLDHSFMPLEGITGPIFRFAPVAIGLALAISSGGKGADAAPLGMLILYLVIAVFSSAVGWHPLISYLKLSFFLLFFIAVWRGAPGLCANAASLNQFRVFMLAFIAVCMVGSAVTYFFFQSIGFSQNAENFFGDDAYAAAIMADRAASGGLTLFSGIFSQSQVLGPFMAMAIAWLILDMLFVECRMSRLHLALCALGAAELFLSRSRTGLLAFVVALWIIGKNAFSTWSVNPLLRQRLRHSANIMAIIIAIAALAMEVRSRAITRWVYKTNDMEEIGQTELVEGVTATRQGSIEANLADYRRNPVFGTGFQVSKQIHEFYAPNAIVFSAPIEKGLLPMMVLGETGIIGSIAFAMFLFSFYHGCSRKHLVATSTLFSAFLATNMGESSFFSAGGMGGIYWIFSIAGGLVIDKSALQIGIRGHQLAFASQLRSFLRRR